MGRLALDQMQLRIKRWRAKREKDGGARLAQVGGALESVSWERVECKLPRACITHDQSTLWTTMRSRSTSDRYCSVYTSTRPWNVKQSYKEATKRTEKSVLSICSWCAY